MSSPLEPSSPPEELPDQLLVPWQPGEQLRFAELQRRDEASWTRPSWCVAGLTVLAARSYPVPWQRLQARCWLLTWYVCCPVAGGAAWQLVQLVGVGVGVVPVSARTVAMAVICALVRLESEPMPPVLDAMAFR